MKVNVRVSALAAVMALLFTVFTAVGFAQGTSSPVLVVNTGALNVRTGPGPQFSVVTVVRGGTTLPVLGFSSDLDNWYLVSSAAGNGWVDVSFTLPRGDFSFVPGISVEMAAESSTSTPQTVTIPGSTVTVPVPQTGGAQSVVNTGRLNVRSGPGPQYSIITSVPGGTSLPTVATNSDGSWLLVEGAFGRGWVYSEFILFRGDFSSLAVINSAY
jgi:uncharacterized protein YraI